MSASVANAITYLHMYFLVFCVCLLRTRIAHSRRRENRCRSSIFSRHWDVSVICRHAKATFVFSHGTLRQKAIQRCRCTYPCETDYLRNCLLKSHHCDIMHNYLLFCYCYALYIVHKEALTSRAYLNGINFSTIRFYTCTIAILNYVCTTSRHARLLSFIQP